MKQSAITGCALKDATLAICPLHNNGPRTHKAPKHNKRRVAHELVMVAPQELVTYCSIKTGKVILAFYLWDTVKIVVSGQLRGEVCPPAWATWVLVVVWLQARSRGVGAGGGGSSTPPPQPPGAGGGAGARLDPPPPNHFFYQIYLEDTLI